MKTLKGAVWILGVLMLAYLIRTVGRKTDADIQTEKSQAILAAVAPFVDSMAVLRQRDSTFIRVAQQAQRDAAVSAAQLRSLGNQLERASTAKDTIRVQDSLITTQRWMIVTTEARCNALDSAFTGCGARAQLLQVRLDTLESALRRQVAVTGCKVPFLPCLSRVQNLGLGLILGGVTGVVLTR